MTGPVRNLHQGGEQGGEIVEFRSPAAARQAQRLHRCPCCGCRTLRQRGRLEMCPVCAWGDAGQDEHDADTVRGGLRGSASTRPITADDLPKPVASDQEIERAARAGSPTGRGDL